MLLEKNKQIHEFSTQNNYCYVAIKNIFYNSKNKNTLNDLSDEERLKYAEKIYLRRQEIKSIKNAFQLLESSQTSKNLRQVCQILKISWPHIQRLSYKNHSKKTLIYYTWFFYDKEENDLKVITYRHFKNIFNMKNQNLSIYELIVHYKYGHKNMADKILDYYQNLIEKYTNYMISHYMKNYIIETSELINQSVIILFDTLSKVVLNNINSINCYVRKILFGRLVDFSRLYSKNNIEFNEDYMKGKEVYDY